MNTQQAKRKLWLEAAALLAAAVLASMFAAPALGQGKPPAEPGAVPCAPHQPPGAPGSTVGSAGDPRSNGSPPQNLSDKLASSDGVLCPPTGVDPEIKLPTPPTGSDMPVIPPPGSPGGDPSVRPK
jgi:hypothetical protein